MVFLFVFIVFLVFILFIMLFSKIRIQIINLKFTSENKKHLNDNYKIIIKLCLFGKIPIFKSKINKEKIDKSKVLEKIKNINFNQIQIKDNINKTSLKALKNIKIEINNINLNIELGTENSALTAIIIPTISTFINIFLGRKVKDYNKQIFIIKPIYINENLINIALSGIFEIKMIHIINIISILIRNKGVDKNERTSNRRSYDYSYE